jgi:class 3 adenylate cyclase
LASPLSERLGEEGTFILIQQSMRAHGPRSARAVSVQDFVGDGIMALFGVPDALEDARLGSPAAEVFRAEPGSNRAENFVALARVQIERPVSTGYPGEMSPWPKIPADVITWFRTAFAEANRAATSRLLNVPTQVSSTSRLTLCNAS